MKFLVYLLILNLLSVPSWAQFQSWSSRQGPATLKQKSENAYRDVWSLSDYFETQRKNRLMDQWLAMNSSSNPFEFALGAQTVLYDSRVKTNGIKGLTKEFRLTQMKTPSKGLSVILRELKEKGISDSTITLSLCEYPEEQQIQTAVKLIEKLKGKYKKLSQVMMKQKMEQALAVKGYSFSIIQEAFQRTNTEKESDEAWEALQYQGMKVHRRFSKYEGWEYQQKMKQALYRKGFSIDQIQSFLDSIEEE